jgi:hypothetical protein
MLGTPKKRPALERAFGEKEKLCELFNYLFFLGAFFFAGINSATSCSGIQR